MGDKIGQQEVIDILKENRGEMTSQEICSLLKIELRPIQKAIQKLLKEKVISNRELSFEEKKEKFGGVVNSRIYIYWVDG